MKLAYQWVSAVVVNACRCIYVHGDVLSCVQTHWRACGCIGTWMWDRNNNMYL